MADDRPHLLMIYNADGGPIAMIGDALHKVFSPATYPCSLCAITYGPVSMKGEWRRFIAGLPARVTFHHRDDFANTWPRARFALPAILHETDGTLGELVSARELDAIDSLGTLSALVAERIAHLQRV